jgi:hypothetical protein
MLTGVTETKICRGECGRKLALEEFSVDHSKRGGRRNICRQCDAASARARYAEKAKANGRRVRGMSVGSIPVARRRSLDEPIPPPTTLAEILGRTS